MRTIEFEYEATIEYSPLKKKLKCIAEVDTQNRVKEVKSYLTPPYVERIYTPNTNTEILIKERAKELCGYTYQRVSAALDSKTPGDKIKTEFEDLGCKMADKNFRVLTPELRIILQASKDNNNRVSARMLQDIYNVKNTATEIQKIIEESGMFVKKVTGRGFSFFIKEEFKPLYKSL